MTWSTGSQVLAYCMTIITLLGMICASAKHLMSRYLPDIVPNTLNEWNRV